MGNPRRRPGVKFQQGRADDPTERQGPWQRRWQDTVINEGVERQAEGEGQAQRKGQEQARKKRRSTATTERIRQKGEGWKGQRQTERQAATPTRKMIVAAFWMLVRHMTAEHWAWFFRLQALLDNIYTVLENPIEAIILTADALLPWPVALLLGAHSRKHRFPTLRLLSFFEEGRSCCP